MTKIIETPILETSRLILRPRTLEDSPALQKYFNNWNIIKNLNDKVPWPYPDNGCEDHYINDAKPRIDAGQTMMWSIFLKAKEHAPIGLIEFRIKKIEGDSEERGFWLAEPFWRQGLMSEAVAGLNDYVFDVLKRDRITVQNYADNEGSHRVKEKTGAVLIKTETIKWRGEDRINEIWELTTENWRKFKKENP